MSDESTSRSRRRFVKTGLAGVAVLQVGAATRSAVAADLPRLDEGEPTAKALAYVADAGAMSDDARGGPE